MYVATTFSTRSVHLFFIEDAENSVVLNIWPKYYDNLYSSLTIGWRISVKLTVYFGLSLTIFLQLFASSYIASDRQASEIDMFLVTKGEKSAIPELTDLIIKKNNLFSTHNFTYIKNQPTYSINCSPWPLVSNVKQYFCSFSLAAI